MRSTDQNKIFHAWCGDIAEHLRAVHVPASQDMVKELVLLKLGNTVEILGEKVAMRSSKYKCSENDLTARDIQNDYISMAGLLTQMEAWAATDLDLILVREEV